MNYWAGQEVKKVPSAGSPSNAVTADAYNQVYGGRRVPALCQRWARLGKDDPEHRLPCNTCRREPAQLCIYSGRIMNYLASICPGLSSLQTSSQANEELAHYWFSSSASPKQCFSSGSDFLDLTAAASRAFLPNDLPLFQMWIWLRHALVLDPSMAYHCHTREGRFYMRTIIFILTFV